MLAPASRQNLSFKGVVPLMRKYQSHRSSLTTLTVMKNVCYQRSLNFLKINKQEFRIPCSTQGYVSVLYLGNRCQFHTYCLINCTASSYFIPHSISARATKTGALVKKKNCSIQHLPVHTQERIILLSLLPWRSKKDMQRTEEKAKKDGKVFYITGQLYRVFKLCIALKKKKKEELALVNLSFVHLTSGIWEDSRNKM